MARAIVNPKMNRPDIKFLQPKSSKISFSYHEMHITVANWSSNQQHHSQTRAGISTDERIQIAATVASIFRHDETVFLFLLLYLFKKINKFIQLQAFKVYLKGGSYMSNLAKGTSNFSPENKEAMPLQLLHHPQLWFSLLLCPTYSDSVKYFGMV